MVETKRRWRAGLAVPNHGVTCYCGDCRKCRHRLVMRKHRAEMKRLKDLTRIFGNGSSLGWGDSELMLRTKPVFGRRT